MKTTKRYLLRVAAATGGSLLAGGCSMSTTGATDAGTVVDAAGDARPPGTIVHDAGVIVDSGSDLSLGTAPDDGGPIGNAVVDAGISVADAGTTVADAGSDEDATVVIGRPAFDAGEH